ncbi:hypothetical protein [Cryptosporangium aurantiacum]|uniref:Thioredoxin domain-containing protein n=1 Tax=Cryptosporangium aurantiacum TaxID=134849 RepID=A0A1M7N9W5_9ACTN|nr:hypothetical protein [Cryptosporangium aurantiacum]SHN00411.1 hypothetical protein SAMN05443668_102505 [Cryptosporangium aurantiacum]
MSRRPDSDEPASDEPGHDGEIRGLPPDWGTIVVPDDLRELADEIALVQAELAGQDPRRRRRWTRPGLSGPLCALILFLVAAIGSLMVIVLPKPNRPPRREPLASPSVAVGVAGGLVPALSLIGRSGQGSSLREFRPAVLLVSPASCTSCATVRNQMVKATEESQLTVVWITESKEPVTQDPGVPATRLVSLADPTGTARAAIAGVSATGPTAVLVRTDGRIRRIVPNVTDPLQLRPELAALTIR